MKKISTYLLLTLFSVVTMAAEGVGLVLSGGAAKGLAHIGVIQALEDNEIPIDYITGTSMGSIIGGFYAMGLTTQEMIAIIKSDDFASWQSGEIMPKDLYYFRSMEPKPDMFSMSFRILNDDSLTIQPNILPINLINPRQMNYAFLELFATSTAACGGDFDKLMIPYRSIAADIYNKKAVSLKQGDLGDAVRASMTFPFMFRPIVIDGELLFDGGIYNNFPVDVMEHEFSPHYIIGSDVGADNNKRPDPENILDQLATMITSNTNHSDKADLLLDFDFADDVNIWDFSSVNELVQRGYDSTMQHIEEIKKHVKRRLPQAVRTAQRTAFNKKKTQLKFAHVSFDGVTAEQQKYLLKYFPHAGEQFGMDEFQRIYYKLLSENSISEIIPHAIYDSQEQAYTLHLKVKTEDQLELLLGGNLSFTTPTQIYLGAKFQNLSSFGQSAWLDFHLGRVYNGLNLGLRLDFSDNLYVKPQFVMHRFDYFTGDYLFYENDLTRYFDNSEIYAKVAVGFSMTMKTKAEIGLGYGYLTDQYIQDRKLAIEYQELDKSIYSVTNLSAKLESNLLNKKAYPTQGRSWCAKIQLLYGNQEFQSPTFPQHNAQMPYGFWLYAKATYEDYFKLHEHFTLGVTADCAYSTRPLLHNYTSTIIQAPQFSPTPHSRIVFNEGFSANQFVALGIKPIWTISDNLQLRMEGYAFAPFRTIERRADNTAYYSDYFDRIRFMTEATVAYDFKIAIASLYVNYYSIPRNNWNIGVNIGFLLFKEKFME